MSAPDWAHTLLDLAWEPHRGAVKIGMGDLGLPRPRGLATPWDDDNAPRFTVEFTKSGEPVDWAVIVPQPVADREFVRVPLAEWKEDA
jgi:hypothetical protein